MLSREEQDEYAGFVSAQAQEYTLTKKILRKLRSLFISTAAMDQLRVDFIKKTEPSFAEYVTKMSGYDELMTELQIRYFEKRIRTLPRDTLVRLNGELEKIEQVRSEEVRKRLLSNFYNSLNLTYSLNGWFLHVYADELKK